jgi:hypothetical protein
VLNGFEIMKDKYKTYFQPAFLICAVVLALSGGIMSVAIGHLRLGLVKKPLPPKKPLDQMNDNALEPYEIVSKRKIDNKETLRELGAQDEMEWVLEDTRVPEDSPVRKCLLFVTYYDKADVVVHNPDECYTGVGYRRIGGETETVKLTADGQEYDRRLRYIVFSGSNLKSIFSDITFPVMYLFNVNNEYTVSRTETRYVLGRNIVGKYSYYSKVEWKFFNRVFGRTVYPQKDEAIQASEKLLSVLLPVLEEEHWPDWPPLDENESNGQIQK